MLILKPRQRKLPGSILVFAFLSFCVFTNTSCTNKEDDDQRHDSVQTPLEMPIPGNKKNQEKNSSKSNGEQDQEPPPLELSINPSIKTAHSKANTVIFEIKSDKYSQYKYSLINAASDCELKDDEFLGFKKIDEIVSFTLQGEGEKTFCAVGLSPLENKQSSAFKYKWTFDATAPEITDYNIRYSEDKSNQTVTISAASAIDALSKPNELIYKLFISESSENIFDQKSLKETKIGSNIFSVQGLEPSNKYYASISVSDLAGNLESYSLLEVITQAQNILHLGESARSAAIHSQSSDPNEALLWSAVVNGDRVEIIKSAVNSDPMPIYSFDRAGNDQFDLLVADLSSQKYIYLAYKNSSQDIEMMRGTITDNQISMDPAIKILDSTATDINYSHPKLQIDSNNKLWLASIGSFNSGLQQGVLRQSSNSANGDLSAWEAAENVGDTSMQILSHSIHPLGSGTLHYLTNFGTSLKASFFDGTNWNAVDQGTRSSIDYPIPHYHNIFATSVERFKGNLYIGGSYSQALGFDALNNISFYNEQGALTPLGNGLNGAISDMKIIGDRLYILGDFTDGGGISGANGIIAWNGSNWESVAKLQYQGSFKSIAYFRGEIYIAGLFSLTDDNGEPAENLIKITPKNQVVRVTRKSFSGGINKIVSFGDNLLITGAFTSFDGDPTQSYLVKYDGYKFSPFSKEHIFNGSIFAILVSGDDLYFGGSFSAVSEVENSGGIVKFNAEGNGWTGLSPGSLAYYSMDEPAILSLALSGDGILWAGGRFYGAGGDNSLQYLIKYENDTWSGAAESTISIVSSVSPMGDASVLVNGQYVVNASGIVSPRKLPFRNYYNDVAIDGDTFHINTGNAYYGINQAEPLISITKANASRTTGIDSNASISSMLHYDSKIYAAGSFTSFNGDSSIKRMTHWDGAQWSAIPGLSSTTTILCEYDNKILVSGSWASANSVPNTDGIAFYDGSSFSSFLSGDSGGSFSECVTKGNEIMLSGYFTSINGDSSFSRIAYYDGASWNNLGGGFENFVDALAIGDNSIYTFVRYSGEAYNHVLEWDGSSWNQLGEGITGTPPELHALGDRLFAVGRFYFESSSDEYVNFAEWDGSAWKIIKSSSGESIREVHAYKSGFLALMSSSMLTYTPEAISPNVGSYHARQLTADKTIVSTIGTEGEVSVHIIQGNTLSSSKTMVSDSSKNQFTESCLQLSTENDIILNINNAGSVKKISLGADLSLQSSETVYDSGRAENLYCLPSSTSPAFHTGLIRFGAGGERYLEVID